MLNGFIYKIMRKDYTFIFVAKKMNPQDAGAIFTSTLPDRIFGWRNSDIIFKVGRFETSNLLKIARWDG